MAEAEKWKRGKPKGRKGASIDFPTAENEWEIREREIADSRGREGSRRESISQGWQWRIIANTRPILRLAKRR